MFKTKQLMKSLRILLNLGKKCTLHKIMADLLLYTTWQHLIKLNYFTAYLLKQTKYKYCLKQEKFIRRINFSKRRFFPLSSEVWGTKKYRRLSEGWQPWPPFHKGMSQYPQDICYCSGDHNATVSSLLRM